MTATVEQQVVASTWKGFSYDLVANNLNGLTEYATTDARLTVRGSLLCGCTPWPTAYTHVSYSTPPQKTFPVSFLAEFSGIDYQQKTFFRDVIFTQASKGAPWLVASTGTYEAPKSLLSPTAHVVTSPPPAPQLTKAPSNFAGFFQQIDSTGSSTNSVPTGFATTPLLAALANGSRTSYGDYQADGVSTTTAHAVVQVSPHFAFPLSVDPGTTATYECFFMTITHTYTAPAGKVLVQTANRVTWTAALSPGSYSPLREDEEKNVCLIEVSGATKVQVLTTLGGPTLVTGTPANGTPVTATTTQGATTTTVPHT